MKRFSLQKEQVNFRFKRFYESDSCDPYYKNVTIINDDSSVISKRSFKLIDDARVIIYDHNMFIIPATDLLWGVEGNQPI
jgi:hypothetical protein